MTTTQYYTATSIDGFIADPDNSLQWLFQVPSGAMKNDRFPTFFAGIGAMAMGATTYEWAIAHDRLLDNPRKWHEYYGDVPCWVFTHRELPRIPGADLTFVQDDVVAVHERMSQAAGDRNIWLVGGGELVGQFADHGLLDEIYLGIAPVTLGGGAPLLPRRLLATDLSLVDVGSDGYFVFLTYRVQPRIAA